VTRANRRISDERWITSMLVLVLAMSFVGSAAAQEEEEADPPEVTIGERLFLETRFAQAFGALLASDPSATVNTPLSPGDPVMDETRTTDGPLPGPFAGQSMNCRQCHQVDEQLDEVGGGMRTYTDFARRSPIPLRDEDDLTVTTRNSPPLVNASLPRPGGVLVHFDGEFPSLPDLVKGTITGRNFGYLPREGGQAVALVARVIREDDGTGELASEFGATAYRDLLEGTPGLPAELQLPSAFRLADVDAASDAEVFDVVARLISAYVAQLEFENASPFDLFLVANGLPVRPRVGESDRSYTLRLDRAVKRLRRPVFIDDGSFEFHEQDRTFGPTELAGLRIFLSRTPGHSRTRKRHTGVGNCSACHPAPDFTDFGFHNTGISQDEYERVHGAGTFQSLRVPHLQERLRDPEPWVPATARTPNGAEPFRRPASPTNDRHTDLGLWNVFANPDFPGPQRKIADILCRQALEEGPGRVVRSRPRKAWAAFFLCNTSRLLDRSLARFKTPGLRDLGHSAPYFHDGSRDDLEGVIRFYERISEDARDGRVRNADPEIERIFLGEDDIEPLIRFLQSLNEDYS